jgi:predicted proteasome-type protease
VGRLQAWSRGFTSSTLKATSLRRAQKRRFSKLAKPNMGDQYWSFADITKLLMVSFDSTLKANLSVGMPLDVLLYKNDEFAAFHERRITSTDPYFESISDSWSEALRNAFQSLPDYVLDE